MPPNVAVTQLADQDGIILGAGGGNAKYVKELMSSGLVCIVVYSEPPRHHTYLELLADATKELPWKVTYKDSLKNPSTSRIETASRILTDLGLKELVGQVCPVNKAFQEDAWSCGLWSLTWVEAAMRKFRGEPVIPSAGLRDTKAFLNKFIAMVKKTLIPKAVAAPKAKAKGKTHLNIDPEHATLEDALAVAQKCSKCEPTKLGIKGCTTCMGKWFDMIRVKRAPAKFLDAL